jgi:hypothetical protein
MKRWTRSRRIDGKYELNALSTPRAGLEPVLDRVAGFERRLDEAMRRPDSTLAAAEILKALSTVLTPLIERAASPGPSEARPRRPSWLQLGVVVPHENKWDKLPARTHSKVSSRRRTDVL